MSKQKMRMVIVEYTMKDGSANWQTRRMHWMPSIGYYIWWKNTPLPINYSDQKVTIA